MEKILSVIIPTYNMEDLLPRCLESLLIEKNQECLEVWVVNDGSKDASSAIAHEFQNKYPNLFKVIDKSNANYGSCINAALPRCSGKYVKVLDADDYFDTKGLERMLATMAVVDVDVFFTDFKTFGVENNYNEINWLDKNVVLETSSLKDVFIAMHSIAYRTSMLKKLNYIQTEKISYTDTEWVFYPFFEAESMYYMDTPVYMYYIGREGQTMDPKVLLRQVSHLKIILYRMLSFYAGYEKQKLNAGVLSYIEYRIWILLNDVYSRYLIYTPSKEKIKEIYQLDEFLRVEVPELYEKIGSAEIPSARMRYYFIKLLRKPSHGILLALSKIYAIIKATN